MNPYNQPYFGRPTGYMYNPYQQMQPMPQPMAQPMQQPIQQPIQQPVQPMQTIGLQGKSVDSIDVVKAMDIPLDGSVSYFPLVDGTAIITKQLQMDGTSKTIIYEPVKPEKEEQQNGIPNYITAEDLNKQVKIINQGNENVKDGINSIQEQIETLSNSLKELTNEMKTFKGGKR